MAPEGKKPRWLFKAAARSGAQYTLIVGEDEVASGLFTLKDMAKGSQVSLDKAALVDVLHVAS